MFLDGIFRKVDETAEFPNIEELSYEQYKAINFDIESNNLIIGAPGTGKTIVALYRLHELYNKGYKNCVMLVFNRALMKYIKTIQIMKNWENEFDVYTVNDFAYNVLYSGSVDKPKEGGIKNSPVPNEEGNKWAIDWKKVKLDFKNDGKIFDHIVVDEGQDFSIDFYKFIVNVSKYVTVFADPNQSLQKKHISIQDILNIIGKDINYTLTLNYRNNRAIANFTRNYCYDRSIYAESYKEGKKIKILEYPKNDEECYEDIYNIIKEVGIGKEVGIIVPSIKNATDEEKRKMSFGIYKYLDEKIGKLQNVEVYYNEKTSEEKEADEEDNIYKDKKNVDFSKKTIKIFNYETVRGLDFDVVILLDNISSKINVNAQEIEDDNIISILNRIYVASTRAKEDLYVIPLDEQSKEFVENANDIDMCLDFPVLHNEDKNIYYLKAEDYYKNGNKIMSLYYLHYLLSVVGFEEDIDLYKEAVLLFAKICEQYDKNDFGISILLNFIDKNDFNDKLKEIYNKLEINSFKNKRQAVTEPFDPTKKERKREVVSKIIYLLGLEKSKYDEEEYEGKIYDELEKNENAKIIRNLCYARNICFNNYNKIKEIYNNKKISLYNMNNIFPQKLYNFFVEKNIKFSDNDWKCIEKFEMTLNKKIQERIGNITNIFSWINNNYIKNLFVIPKGDEYNSLTQEVNRYNINKNKYPYNLYFYGKPNNEKNVFADDKIFLTNLYNWNNDVYTDIGKVEDISPKKREEFYDFLDKHKKIIMFVDCENTDVYKLIAAINGIDDDHKEKISKIILVDDENTTDVWKYIKYYINIEIEYKEEKRITPNKSLVDHLLVQEVVKAKYKDNIDGVIISSSDSDFGSLMNENKDLGFFVMVQHGMISEEYKKYMEERGAKYCYIDDFNSKESDYIKEDIFKNSLVATMNDNSICANCYDLTEEILKSMRANMNNEEIKNIANKYTRNLKIYIDENDEIKFRI